MPASRHVWCPLISLVAIGTTAFGVGCSDDDNPVDPGPTTGTVMIAIEHKVGPADLELGPIQYTNAFGNEYGVSNLEYFLSDFYLTTDEGRHDVDAAYYVSAEDENTHVIRLEGVPTGHYHVLGFTFGLDEEANVTGALDGRSAAIDNMFWPESMGGGYHYLKLEGRFLREDQTESGYATHAGRFRAAGRDEPHFVRETATMHQNIVADETLILTLQVNVNNWYDGPNVIDLTTHNAIMDNKERQDELEENCGDVFTLLGGGTHGRP